MAEEEQTINLKILSPSAEVEGGVNLAHVPASTTVKELRNRIRDAVPSKPATERMRLIYRGRVVANDADTLGNVFGTDNIRESKDQSLHLVLRELPDNDTHPIRPTQASTTLPTNPFRTLPQTRPNSQPPTPQPQPHHHPHVPGQVNLVPVPVALPLQSPLVQAMAAQQGNEQTINPTNEQPGHDTQAPADGAQAPASQSPPPLGLPNLPGNAERPPQRNPFDPNGARWTVTYNQVNIPARLQPAPFPIPHALGFGRLPIPTGTAPPGLDNSQRLFPRIQGIIQETLREMDNVRTLLHAPTESGTQTGTQTSSTSSPPNIPAWRVDQLRRHLNAVNHNLSVVERGLALLPAEPEVVALRRVGTELRVAALELSMVLDRQQGGATSNQATSSTDASGPSSTTVPGAPIMTPAVPMAYQSQMRNSAQAMPADAPPELFLLSSPQGPVGILFDQHGIYSTAPMVPTLPFQTFSDQFAQNRQILTGLGQQMAQGSNQLHNQLANIQPTPTQQVATGGQGQNQNQEQNQNQRRNADADANPPAENDRMVNIAGHLWLIFKLAAFVYFFAGGGGLYRPVMLGIVAFVVYLAQVGAFQDQINLMRHHFEALLPVGAMAERIVQPNNQAQAQHRGNLTPEEAARRIMQQRRDQRFGWVRDSMRTVERAFALFVASLFPGVGERMVHAQEERERLERVAAQEERQRREDEARRLEEEAQAQQQQDGEKKDEAQVDMEAQMNASGSSKGKERAETAAEASESAS